jgi:glycerophosphoryl diester phosphodiesterase/ankyrin repeat protein
MKFGKTIVQHQVPQWVQHYINYKDLKKQIKHLTVLEKEQSLEGPEVGSALAGFFFSLDRNLEEVDDFYNRQYAEHERRLKKITMIVTSLSDDVEGEEIDEIIGVLVELRFNFRNLKWFGELNKRGFVKILKKLDKKTGTSQQNAYLNSRIYPLPFANEGDIVKCLSLINDYLNAISPKTLKTPDSRSPSVQPDRFSRAIYSDDADALFAQLVGEFRSLVLVPVKLMISLLNKCALQQSSNCIARLLEVIPSLADPSDISGRNFFHIHIIALGKQSDEPQVQQPYFRDVPASPPEVNMRLFDTLGPDGMHSSDKPKSLAQILSSLPPYLRPALLQKDHYKRTPLHYAAQYGLKDITTIIIDFLKSWNEWDSAIIIDDLNHWGDFENLTPLHLAVLGKHPKTAQVLISNCDYTLSNSKILVLATRLDSVDILNTLLTCKGVDVNDPDPINNETPLYIASKLNLPNTVKLLLGKGADTEIPEVSFGWTPLFAAAVEGLIEIITLLKDAGAQYSKCDEGGWTPMEHACLRGHLDIADMLKPEPQFAYSQNNSSTSSLESSSNKQKVNDIYKTIKPKAKPTPVKSFGHRYLKDESLIIITLGSNDSRNSAPAVDLDRVPISKVHKTELDTALSLVISTKSQREPAIVVDLPLDDIDAITFSTSAKPEDEVILFDIVPTYGGQHKQILGRGAAFLNKIYTSVGPNRCLLDKIATVPIMETETLDVLGTISFEVLIVKAFQHPNMRLDRTETYWKSLVSTRVIGHRGLGKNTVAKSLQLGENTVESFIAAASLGASYVEFDVQLTKDHVPVVYHDFLVAESGVDIPMHELTLEQFLGFNQGNDNTTTKDDFLFRPRSASLLNHSHNPGLDKMRLTKTFKSLGFKGNSRGSSIASSFVTLKELFKRIPKSVGFNIECKYPILYEAQHEDMGEVAVDLNFWIDTVLKCVYDHADGRDIIFSSFHPEVCLMLSLKQPAIPILFLTESGTSVMADVRCDSLQSAVRFSKRWNLLGIVSAAAPIVKCPRLAQVVKSSGLVCFTYGVDNNDPENARKQMDAGVDAVIVDNVLAVRKELTKEAKQEDILTI